MTVFTMSFDFYSLNVIGVTAVSIAILISIFLQCPLLDGSVCNVGISSNGCISDIFHFTVNSCLCLRNVIRNAGQPLSIDVIIE